MAKSRRSRRQILKGRPLRRRVAFRTPKRTFLVFCEGKRTEPDYLKALKQEPAVRDVASVDIRIAMDASGAVPLTLVNAAADARATAPGQQGEIDEVWCLFDVEAPQSHPNLDEAVTRAEESDVRLAVSNPCFELWLALHYADREAWLDTADAGRLRREHDGSSGKGLDGVQYMRRRTEAAKRARALATRHERDGTAFPNDNPSSGMFRFLAAVERTD